MKVKTKEQARYRRHLRIRKKISGTADLPRLGVFKSNSNFYAQVTNDVEGKTIVSSSTLILKLKSNNIEAVEKVAEDLATKLKSAKLNKVLFDRSGYIYHGKIKAFADKLREKGIEI